MNITAARKFLIDMNIPVNVADVGGKGYRKVVFCNASGEISIVKGEKDG